MNMIGLLSPEITLFMTAIAVLLLEIKCRGERPGVITSVALTGMALALGLTLVTFQNGASEAFSRALVIDPFSQFFKTLLILSGMMTVFLGRLSKEIRNDELVELHSLVILGTVSMCIMSSAVHFLLLFLAYEAAGLACYVLVAFKRRSKLSSEAGLKFFVHGALTSILFAFGIVLLYGLTRTLNIIDLRTGLATTGVSTAYLWVAFGLIFAAIATRMSIFPFHFLTPDVTQGAPLPVSAFFSVSANVASMAFALRLCLHILSTKEGAGWTPFAGFEWHQFVAGVAAVTMTIGNLTALYQTNIKRLIGYSTVAQMGYVLMGLTVSNHTGITAVLFSLAAYGIITLGAFFVIQLVTDHARSEDISVLKGLVWKNPFEGVALCIFLIGLAGLPPLVGFVGRFYVLGVIIKEKYYWLAIVGAINWVLGLTYYLSMIRQVFATAGRAAGDSAVPSGLPVKLALSFLLIPTFALGIFWDPLMNRIQDFLGMVVW